MPSDIPATKRPQAGHRRRGMTLALLAFAQLIISLDYTIVYVALPDIGRLGFSAQTLQLVVSAYAVAFGGVLLLGGRAADLFGRRRMFVGGLALYAAASLVGGLSTTPELLVGARVLQGLGGALLFPATLSLVNTLFAEGRERNHALGVWAGAGAAGMVAGVLLGGALTQALGWQAVFFVNIPLAGIALAVAFPLIPVDPPAAARRAFDLAGALTATVGMTLIIYALVQAPAAGWTATDVVASGGIGVLALGSFVMIESRTPDPLMPLRLFHNRHLRLGVTITFLFMATFGTLLYFLTVYFQDVEAYSPLRTGVACLVPMGGVFVGSNLGGHLMTRFGVRATLVVNLLLGAVGMVALSLTAKPDADYLALVPGLTVLSFGQGVVFPTMFAAVATGVPGHDQGIASGIASSGQQVGSAVGLAILVAIANSGTDGLNGQALRAATDDGVRTAMLVAAAGIVLTALVASMLRQAPPLATAPRAQPASADA
jgi:EmrB/QacA subfamily drug resistance transporter